MSADRLLTAPEVAERLRVTVQTLAAWRWRKQGPPFIKFGRRVRYDPADLNDWIRRSRDDSGATL